MNNFKLPRIPQDVLDAMDTLPADTLANIDWQILLTSTVEIGNNPALVATEKAIEKLVIKNGLEKIRLIREAVKERKNNWNSGGNTRTRSHGSGR